MKKIFTVRELILEEIDKSVAEEKANPNQSQKGGKSLLQYYAQSIISGQSNVEKEEIL